MDRELSDQLTEQMPIVPHCTVPGVDCCGCISAAVEGSNVELRCNECATVVGVVQLDILKGMLALECATGTCQHCGRENAFPGFDQLIVYTCQHCGMSAEPEGARIKTDDDNCQWYTFEGTEPIAVMPCNRCGRVTRMWMTTARLARYVVAGRRCLRGTLSRPSRFGTGSWGRGTEGGRCERPIPKRNSRFEARNAMVDPGERASN
jgi:hypothetical protein